MAADELALGEPPPGSTEQLLKEQLRKAASVCRERLNRQSRNVHSVKTAPSSVLSEKSTPMNATRVCSRRERSSPNQSAPSDLGLRGRWPPHHILGHPPAGAQPCSIRLATRAATSTGSHTGENGGA